MKSKINSTDLEKIQAAFSDEWKTAREIKQDVGLKMSNQKFGRILASITKDNNQIESGMKGHTLAYRKIHVDTEGQTQTSTEPEISPETPEPENIEKKLDTLITDLTLEGLDVKEICYNALKETKEKHEDETKMVQKKAPLFYSQYKNMKNLVKKMGNQSEDLKDKIRDLEKKILSKSISEERSQRMDLLA